MKENRLIYKETSETYSEAEAPVRYFAARNFLRNPLRIEATTKANADTSIIATISASTDSRPASFLSINDVALDADAREYATIGYDDAEVRDLTQVFGSAAGVEARTNIRAAVFKALQETNDGKTLEELIQLVEADQAQLPYIEKQKILTLLRKRLVFVINSNPRLLATALAGKEIFGPIKEALDGQYEENPNGLPWIFTGNESTLVTTQGWPNYSPLSDLNPLNLQTLGLIGTATDVYRTLFGEPKRIQFSSAFASQAAEKILKEQTAQCIVWAVPDFKERYEADPEFQILADIVLRLTTRESWVSYGDGFGNLVILERPNVNKVKSAVEEAALGKELSVVLNNTVFRATKVNNLCDAQPGKICIYNNGEDSQSNSNIVVPWIENSNQAIAKASIELARQGVPAINIIAEIARAKIEASRRSDGVLRLSAENLLCGLKKHLGGHTLASREIRVLRANNSQTKTQNALSEVNFSDSLTRKKY